MLKTSTTTLLGIIALAITGCGSSDNPQSASPAPSPPPVAVSPSPVKPQPPVIAQNPSGTAYLAPSLIQPTNANQRVKQVAKGRRDPFAALFAPVTTPIPVSVAPPNSPTAAVPTSSSSNNNNNSQQASSNTSTARSSGSSRRQPTSTVAARNSRSSNRSSASSNNPRSSNPPRVSVGGQSRPNQTTPGTPNTSPLNPPPPSSLPGNNLPPAPPEQLAPELAQNVTVMGVIQIGESTQAIVQVPNEPTSRYVQVGQRLSNGQVLVKRIEMNEGAEPLVVLEQYGVEVAKAVGEQPANQNNGQTQPTAALPSPVPENPVRQAANPSPIPQNIITTQAVNPSPIPQNITTTDTLSVPPPPPNTPAVEAN